MASQENIIEINQESQGSNSSNDCSSTSSICSSLSISDSTNNNVDISNKNNNNNKTINEEKLKLLKTIEQQQQEILEVAFESLTLEQGNMFDEVFESKSGDFKEAPLEEGASALPDGIHKNCGICLNRLNSPRILSCLHVFCESCLDKLLINGSGDSKNNMECAIECPTCEQPTKVGVNGAASLLCDYIYTNILDLSTIEPEMLACTSCKSKESAISRCNDCANFLCAGCDNAHKYMRCFEHHEVVKLEDLQKSAEKVTIHKPLFCNVHTSENLKYYCFNCQIPVCNDCLIADHKGSEHHYEVITNAEKSARMDIEGLIQEAKGKVKYCNSAASNLNSALTDLQTQHDIARSSIEETYQSFKAVIEKCREMALKDLERLHSERELKIMDLLHNVEKTIEKIDGVCKFSNRVLDQANAAEFLSMKKLISLQFKNLIGSVPKADINYSLDFETKFEKFEQLAQDTFGKFRTECTPPSPKESTPPPTLPGLPPNLMNNRTMNSSNSQSALNGSVTASSPISLPTSMQSSFDGDISTLGQGFMLPANIMNNDSAQSQHSVGNPIANINSAAAAVAGPNLGGSVVNGAGPIGPNNSGVPSVPGFSSIAEYNLQRLANLAVEAAGSADLTDSIVPVSNPSPVSQQITLADLLSGDQRAFNNLQALAKIGLNGSDIDTVDFGTDLTTDSLLMQGPTSGIDTFLNDFVGLPPPTSPMPSSQLATLNGTTGGIPNGSSVDDLGLPPPAYPSVGVPGRSKATPMQIRCKFGSLGTSKGQFNSPHGFCLGVDEEIIVADTNNHRIEVFEKNGTFKFQFGVPGKEEGQLWYPRKVAVMTTNSKFVVCDRGNERSRMQIFSKNGHFMKKIAIRYIDIVAGLAVTAKGQIVAVDSVSPTVFIISEDGDLLHWFDCSDYMREPSDIAIRDDNFYVCDFKGHCVAVFKDNGTFQYRIGNEKVTCFPNGIDISNAGDILIGDSHGNRFHVACFSRDGVLQSEFECPHVKVSRCCGLKITSEGFVVTLAKNNHHVLVLNTLYLH